MRGELFARDLENFKSIIPTVTVQADYLHATLRTLFAIVMWITAYLNLGTSRLQCPGNLFCFWQ